MSNEDKMIIDEKQEYLHKMKKLYVQAYRVKKTVESKSRATRAGEIPGRSTTRVWRRREPV